MPSLGARVARLVARVSTKIPISRALGKPDFVERYRATLEPMRLIFGRVPRDVTRTRVDDREAHVCGEWMRSNDARRATVVLYLHGGGYAGGTPEQYRSLTGAIARACACAVFVPDYRLAPEHPYPAALEDAMAAYEWLLARGVDPASIVVAGDSAGGGLAATLLLAARDRARPLPAGGALLSPWLDLSGSGASFRENAKLDDVVVYDESATLAHLYAGDRALDDPAVSPLFANLTGLPPLLLQASSIEAVRDDAVRFAVRAREAGVDVRLHLWDGVQHVWQLFTGLPESREALAEIATFVENRVRSHTMS